MPDISPSIPVAGQPNSSEEPKIVTALTQLVGAVNDVDSAQILDLSIANADVADATLQDAKLASPNNSVWRTVQSWTVMLGESLGAFGVRTLGGLDGAAPLQGVEVGKPVYFMPTLADYAVAGKTLQWRLIHSLSNGTVVTGGTLTLSLHALTAVTGSTGSGVIVSVNTTAVTSSGLSFTTPLSGTPFRGASGAFTLVDGTTYLPGIVNSVATNAGSVLTGSVALQMRHT